MPNRVMREGIIDSELVAKLGAHSENFFFRAIIVADDAGRLDGRLTVLASKTYPITSHRESDVGKRLADCVKLGLAKVYAWDDKPYVQIMKWQRCSSTQVSKFPDDRGKYRIEWVKIETRDGEKEFVSSSVDTVSRNGRGKEGVDTGSLGGLTHLPKKYGDGDGDGDGDGKNGAIPSHPTSDEVWIRGLQESEAYKELDVKQQFLKMTQWCLANHKQPTRKRFINWLNRCDRPMTQAQAARQTLKTFHGRAES
jgi:hypothetical protein